MNTRNPTLSFACALLAATTLTAHAGLVLKQTVKSEGKDSASAMQNAAQTISVEGNGMRIEYVESKNPSFKKGDYMVSHDGGKTFYMVQPKNKTYMKFDLAMAGSMMSMMKMKISDAKSELLLDEAGPKMLGYPTRHTKTVVSYKMEMNFMGMQQSNQSVNEIEMWATTKIDSSTLEAWARNLAGRSGHKELDELMQTSIKNVKGMPLKQISVMTTTDKDGRKTTQTTTSEVTDVKEQSLPAAMFELPAGYKDVMESAMSRNAEDKSGGDAESGAGEAPKHRKGPPSFSDIMKMMQEK